MGKRLLASFLAAAMMLTMAPFAFAVDGDTEDTTVTTESVAKIGDRGYESLAAAFAEAKDGDTITVLKSTSGNGIQVESGRFTNEGLTVDFNGNTYTVGGVLVGSAGTGTNAFQLLANNKITLKNGSIVGATENTKPAEDTTDWHGAPAIVIQNYCNLTLDGMTITGGTETVYTMSNNCGNVVINDTTINVGEAKGYGHSPYAFDVCRYSSYPSVSVTVEGNSVVNGDVEVSGTIGEGQSRQLNIKDGTFTGNFMVSGDVPANIVITGGTFYSYPNRQYLPDGYDIQSTYDWNAGKSIYKIVDNRYAEVNGKYYSNLNLALTEAANGGTINLLKDMQDHLQVIGDEDVTPNVTLNLNGHTLRYNGSPIDVYQGKLTINGPGTIKENTPKIGAILVKGSSNQADADYASVTVNKDVTLEGWAPVFVDQLSNGYPQAYGITVNLNGATLNAKTDKSGNVGCGIYVNGNIKDTVNAPVINVDSTTINSTGQGLYLAGYNTTTINSGTITADQTGAEIRAGKLTVNGTVINSKATKTTVTPNGSGATTVGAGIAIAQHTTKLPTEVAISGGQISGASAIYESNPQKNDADSVAKVKLSVTGGQFKGDVYSEDVTGFISGGTFTTDVTDYAAPGYTAEKTNGVYVVKSGTNDALAKVDEAIKEGASETEIKAAVDAVVSTPNATLANSSTTMDKLAKLEEVYKNANTGTNTITVKVENGTADKKPDTELQAAKNAALSASAGETVTINVDKNADKQTDAENAIKAATQADAVTVEALDITMKIDGTETQPKAPVVLTFELPNDKQNAQIYRIEGNTATKIPTTLNVNAEGKRTISGTFDHFSTYGIQYLNATANENKYTLILQPNTREVSAGDTLTYTVSLRHDAGSDNDTISGLRFNLDANEGLKLNPSASKGFDNTVKFGQTGGNGNYQFNFVGTKTLQTNQTMSVGTLSYTVQDYGNNGDKVTAPVANTTVVTNSGTNVLPSLSVDSGDVTYHEIELTFVQPDGTSNKYYARYNKTGLYETIAKMIAGSAMTAAPTIIDPESTAFRLVDNQNWYAESDMQTQYDIGTTTNIISTTYVTKTQEIVKINADINVVTITSSPVTVRNSERYIDKGTDLSFTVQDADNGMKNKVTATIGHGTPEELTPANGTYTVLGNKITDDVTITVTQELALTAADIKIFKTDSTNGGVQGYLPYSTYSGTRTLVLIKGAAGVNYTLGENQPEIFALPAGAYKTGDGTASYTHAVLMEPTDVVSEEAMLTALKNAGLRTTADNVTLITYDWKTAGEGALDFQNVTTTYDFKSLTADKFKWDPSDAQLLKADVLNLAGETNVYQEGSYQTARDGHVSDEDVAAFMYLYAKLAK